MMRIFGQRVGGRVGLFLVHGVSILGVLAISGCDRAVESRGTKTVGKVAAREKKPEKIGLRGEPTISGQKYRVTESFITSNGKISMTIVGRRMQGTTESTSKSVTEYELISATERHAVMTEDMEEHTRVMMGQSQSESEENVLVGKHVIGKLQDGRWLFALADGEPTEEESEELSSMSNPDDNELYPRKPVKIGDTFKITGKQMKAFLADVITRDASGSGQGRIEEIVDHAGHRCARIAMKIDARGIVEEDGQELQMTIKVEGEVLRSLEIFEDLKSEMEGTISMGGELEAAPGQPMSMSIIADLVFSVDTEMLRQAPGS